VTDIEKMVTRTKIYSKTTSIFLFLIKNRHFGELAKNE